jgi:FkbM family methyltransferase
LGARYRAMLTYNAPRRQRPPMELFPIAIRKTRFRGFQLYFENEEATESMVRAIDEFPSFFTPQAISPLIIDCGANIGVSVLEWKYRWPMSRVICFEPDPFAFELLEMNVERNDIPGIQCFQKAISDIDGTAKLHGDLGHGADARGNSLRPAWGKRRQSGEVDVTCTRLAPYLQSEPVAFLKLDIEGAEEGVLRDSAEALASVEAAYVEVHETNELDEENSLGRIEELLRKADFQLEIESRFDAHALPASQHSWQQRVGAKQSQLLCWR